MDKIEELKKLKALQDQGAITIEEFNTLKKRIISESSQKQNQEKTALNQEKNESNEKVQSDSSNKGSSTDKDSTQAEISSHSKYYLIKVILFLSLLFAFIIFSIIQESEESGSSLIGGLFGGLIAAAWWVFRIGKRTTLFFYAPYLLFIISTVFFSTIFDASQEDYESSKFFFWALLIVGLLAFLFEYFALQAKCSNCGKRSGMKKISESDFDSYGYIGTKTYDIRANSGKKIGEYDGAVSRTAYNFTAHYRCIYCNSLTARRESEHYDN